MIVTTGAGVAVPFAWIGRLFGARVVYVESLTRIDKPSLSYRLIRPVVVADLRPVARAAPPRRALPRHRLRPRVIFVTLGTQAYQFDRLLRGLEGVGEELVVQGGPSSVRPAGATWFDFLEYPALLEHIRRARVVVSHAGIGSVITVVAENKRPVVVPRLHRYGEAVDDHQVPIARRLADAGLVSLVEDPDQLAAALVETPAAPATLGGEGGIVADLRAYLLEIAEIT